MIRSTKFKKIMKNVKGFSLIEVALVLMIMGLIAVSIVSGTSVLEQANNRAIMNEFKGVQENFILFNLANEGIPGDMSNAKAALGNHDTSCDKIATGTADLSGNGNGQVEHSNTSTLLNNEVSFVWCHLYLYGAGYGKFTLNTGATQIVPGTHVPSSRTNRGGLIVFYETAESMNANVVMLTSPKGADIQLAASRGGSVTPRQAQSILNKFDNGRPGDGNLRVFNDIGTAGACVTGTVPGNTVDLTKTGVSCVLAYKIAT